MLCYVKLNYVVVGIPENATLFDVGVCVFAVIWCPQSPFVQNLTQHTWIVCNKDNWKWISVDDAFK